MPTTVRGGDIVFNNGTVQSTAFTGAVTSVATGNGLQGGTITSTGTLSIACPAFNTVGSYCCAGNFASPSFNPGSNYAAGEGVNQMVAGGVRQINDCALTFIIFTGAQISGTWKWMAGPSSGQYFLGLACRVS